MGWRAGRTWSALRPWLRTRRSLLPRRGLGPRSSSFRLRRPSLMRLRAWSGSAFGSLRRFMRFSSSRPAFRRLGSLMCLRRTRPAHRRFSSLMGLRRSARPALRGLGSLTRFRSSRSALRRPGSLMRLWSTRPAHRGPSLIRTSRSFPARCRLRFMRTSRLRLAHRSTSGARTSSSRPALRRPLRRLRLMPASRSRPALTGSSHSPRFSPSLSRPCRPACRHYTPAAKLSRLRSSGNRRPSMVHRSQHRMISAGSPLMLCLRRRQPHMRISPRSLLRRRRPSRQASSPAVIAHPAHRPVIHRAARVNVIESSSVYPVHRAVVIESSMVPVPALISDSYIAEAIVDAAIEAHRRPPVARIPQISAVAPAPISRRPQQANLGRLNPRSRNPVVALVAISPVARRP
jgi:hypothetical protein